MPPPGTDLVVRVGVQGVEKFNKGFRAMGRETVNFADIAMSHYKGLGILFSTMGGGILAAGNQLLQGTKNFEAAMRNVQTVSRAAQVDFQRVAQDVMAVGQATNTSAEEAANGLYNVVSSGFDGADAIKVLHASLISASAGLTDTGTATRAVTAVLNAYSLNAAQAGDVSDILFQTVNLGVGTFEELANAVGDVAGIAAQVGVPFADVAAAIAAASRSGQNFDEAATGVNRIMQDLLDPTPAMVQVLHEMGFETGQAALKAMTLEGVMGAIRQRVGDNAAAYVTLFGRIEAVKTSLALAADEGQNYADVSGQITDKQARAQAAQKAFSIQMRGLNAQAKELRNSFYIFMQGGLLPLLTLFEKTGSAGAKVLDFLSKMHPALKTAAVVGALAFGAFTLLVGLLLLALPKAAVIAAVMIGRVIIKNNEAAMAALRHAMANDLLTRSLMNAGKFMLNFNAAMGIARKGMQVAAWAGSLAMIAVAFDALFMGANKVAKGMKMVNDSMSDDDVTKLVSDYGEMIEKSQLLRSNAGKLSHDINIMGQVIDKVLQTNFSFFTGLDQTNEAFKEMAKTAPQAAARLIESAKAAGVNAEAIYRMEKALWDAKVAQEETTKATGLGASEFQTASGQMVLLADDIKEKIDDLRESAEGISGSFGGMFGDAEQRFKELTKASTDAADSVKDAEDALTDANEALSKVQMEGPRDAAKNLRALEKAQRDLDNMNKRKPRRQRGERKADYEARIAEERADAEERLADAKQRITDQGSSEADALNKVEDATKKVTDAKKAQAESDNALVMTGDKLLAQIKTQQKAQQDFFNNISKLRQRLGTAGSGFIQELVKKGPKEGGLETQTLAGMDDKSLREFFNTWKDIQAIGTGLAIGDVTKMTPTEIGANLEELWGQVGGNVGRFIELGAAVGDEALRKFLNDKVPQGASNVINKLTGAIDTVLAPEHELKIKAVFADDSAKIPGLTMTADEFKAQGAIPITFAPELTAPPTPPPTGPAAPPPLNPAAASGSTSRGAGPLAIGKAVGGWLGGLAGLAGFAGGGLFSEKEGLAMLHGPEAIIPMNSRSNALAAMQKSGLAGFLGSGGGGTTDQSTTIQHIYKVEKIETPDPAAFERWAANRQRMNSLAGV